VAISYLSGVFLSALDIHIINVALPTLSRVFHAGIEEIQWTVTGYVLSLAVIIPASGWLGDRFGTKRMYLVAIGIFTVASALCGQARTLPELIAARVLQGVGGGMLTPIGSAMLYRAYPPERRARMTRILLLPIVVAPGMAPVVGGWIIGALSWRWAFYINLPVGIFGFLFGARYLVEHREPVDAPFDATGFVLAGGGLSLLLYAVSQGPLQGWTSPAVLVSGLLSAASLIGFVQVERRLTHPLLRLTLLKDRLFRATNIVNGLGSAAFLGLLYLVPSFLQVVLHLSPLQSGLTTFVEAVGVGCASLTIGRLYPRVGPRRMSAAGGIGVAVASLPLLLVTHGTSLWAVRAIMFLIGFCYAAQILAVQTSMFATISPADTGHASAIFSALRQAAVAFGIAVLTTIVSSAGGAQLPGFRWAFAAASGMAVVSAVTAMALIRDRDAAATMVRRRRPSPADQATSRQTPTRNAS
jgi:EmrB/QacA subfamily drug resistance transporter